MRSQIEILTKIERKARNLRIIRRVNDFNYLGMSKWESRNKAESEEFQIVSCPLTFKEAKKILKYYEYQDNPNYEVLESQKIETKGKYRIVIRDLSIIEPHLEYLTQLMEQVNKENYLGLDGWTYVTKRNQFISPLLNSKQQAEDILKENADILTIEQYKVVESNTNPGKYRICIFHDETNQEYPWDYLINKDLPGHSKKINEQRSKTIEWLKESGLALLNLLTQIGFQEVESFSSLPRKSLIRPTQWSLDEEKLLVVNSGPSRGYDPNGETYNNNLKYSFIFGINQLNLPEELKQLTDAIEIEDHRHGSYYAIPLKIFTDNFQLWSNSTIQNLDMIKSNINVQIEMNKLNLKFFKEKFTDEQCRLLVGCYRFFERVLINTFTPADAAHIIQILLKENRTLSEQQWLSQKIPPSIMFQTLLSDKEIHNRLKFNDVDGGVLKNGKKIRASDVHDFMRLSYSLTELYCQRKILTDSTKTYSPPESKKLERPSISIFINPDKNQNNQDENTRRKDIGSPPI